jgi:NTE family protein
MRQEACLLWPEPGKQPFAFRISPSRYGLTATGNVLMPDDRPYRLVLVLGGGNALGAYQAGLYEALLERGMEPDWIVATSIGAVNAGIIAGNAPDARIGKLVQFWRPAPPAADPTWMFGDALESWRRTAEVMQTLLLGRPGMFGAIGSARLNGLVDPAAQFPALYATGPLEEMLRGLIDFDRLAAGAPRLTVTAVDFETGEDAMFDNSEVALSPDHFRASGALPTAFPAVEIDGRRYADGGLSANLPLDPVLRATHDRPVLCIAADLLPLAGRVPTVLGEAIGRMQDVMFAAQSRRSISRWQADYARRNDPPIVTLLRMAYADQESEVAGKAMDFSPLSVRQRWDSGHRDMTRLLEALENGHIPLGAAGLTVVDGNDDLPAAVADRTLPPDPEPEP